MQPTIMPMPGALRLRALHPLTDGDGSCSLVYDLERAAVVEVPEELQFYVAPALETGDLDEELLGWLVNEDLLTGEGWAGWSEEGEAAGATEASGWWNLGAIYRIDDEIHARICQPGEEAAVAALEFVFRQPMSVGRIRLHLNWDGAFPGRSFLERIVVESARLASRRRQEVVHELTLAAAEVTPAIAAFLADYPFQVRLLCGSYPGAREDAFGRSPAEPWRAEPAVRLLLDRLGDRLTVHCVLDRARLLDIWDWAKRTGVRRLDALRVEDSALSAREFRHDLLAVCEEMAGDLAAQRFPVDYQPLTRIVSRLMRSEPMDRLYGERGGVAGLAHSADVYADLAGLEPRLTPNLWFARDEPVAPAHGEDEADAFPCRGCWARHVCSHSSLVASSLEGEDVREPSEERCSLWRTEVDAALRFYHRLAHTDPIQVLQFFEQPSRESAAQLSRREDLGHLKVPF
jgi:hypothetical protein